MQSKFQSFIEKKIFVSHNFSSLPPRVLKCIYQEYRNIKCLMYDATMKHISQEKSAGLGAGWIGCQRRVGRPARTWASKETLGIDLRSKHH